MVNYGKVLNYVQNRVFYRDTALRNWSNRNISVPWLIAMALNATIITEESTINTGLSTKNPSRNTKVSDVKKHFGVKCENLFYFMI